MAAFSSRSQKYSGKCCQVFQSKAIHQFLQGPASFPWIHPRVPPKYAGLKGAGVEEWYGVGGTLGDKTEGARKGTNLAHLPSSYRKELQTISSSQGRPSNITEGWWSSNWRPKASTRSPSASLLQKGQVIQVRYWLSFMGASRQHVFF